MRPCFKQTNLHQLILLLSVLLGSELTLHSQTRGQSSFLLVHPLGSHRRKGVGPDNSAVAFLGDAKVPGGDVPTYNTNKAVIRMGDISLGEL